MNRFRLWLIKWLADGDALMLNIEYMRDGSLRRKEAGKYINIINSTISHDKECGLSLFSKQPNSMSSALSIECEKTSSFLAEDVHVIGPKVAK